MKLQTPRWVYQARAGDDVKKEMVLDCAWGVVGNLEPVHVSACLHVLAEAASGSLEYHTEVVFYQDLGDSFSSKYLLLQFSALLMSDVIC